MKIDTENIPEIIKNEYGISHSHIDKLDIGFDQNTAVYKLISDDQKTYPRSILKCNTAAFGKNLSGSFKT